MLRNSDLATEEDPYALLLFLAMLTPHPVPLLDALLTSHRQLPDRVITIGACCAVARQEQIDEGTKQKVITLLLHYAQTELLFFADGQPMLESEYNQLWWAFYHIDWQKRWQIVHLLSFIDPQILEQPFRLFEQGKLSEVERTTIFWMAGFLKCNTFRSQALSLIQQKDQHNHALRASAIWYLGYLEDAASVEALYALARDASEPIMIRGAAVWSLVQSCQKEDRFVELLKSNLRDENQAVSWKCLNLRAIRTLQVSELNPVVAQYKQDHVYDDIFIDLEVDRTLIANGYRLSSDEVFTLSIYAFREWIDPQDRHTQKKSVQAILQMHARGFREDALQYCFSTGRQDFLDMTFQLFCELSEEAQDDVLLQLKKYLPFPLVRTDGQFPSPYQEIKDYIQPILSRIALTVSDTGKWRIDTLFIPDQPCSALSMSGKPYHALKIPFTPTEALPSLGPEEIMKLARRGDTRVRSRLRELIWQKQMQERDYAQILLAVFGDYESIPQFLQNLWEEDVFTEENRYVAVESLGIISSGVILRWYQDAYNNEGK